MKTQFNTQLGFKLVAVNAIIERMLVCYSIPENAKRIVLSFRCSNFYIDKQGIQPVEIQIEREKIHDPWRIRFVATFDYPMPEAESLEVALYFNFHFGWFYQPDIQRCELARPEVRSLFHSWVTAFVTHIQHGRFDVQLITLVKSF